MDARVLPFELKTFRGLPIKHGPKPGALNPCGYSAIKNKRRDPQRQNHEGSGDQPQFLFVSDAWHNLEI
jgi:hypothetical protein